MKRHYPIHYLATAEHDLQELFDYLLYHAPARVNRFLNKIDRTIVRLAKFPFSGTIPRDKRLAEKGYRMLVIGDYLVFYRLKRSRVVIHRILHGRRRYHFLFG